MAIKLYDAEISGNCYKVRLFLSLLDLKYQLVPINLMTGEQKTLEFLQLNPLGQVPVLIDDGFILSDSQAILVYLARKYGKEAWLPNDAKSLSLITRWLSISALEISQGLGLARRYYLLNAVSIDLDLVTKKAITILQYLEQHLSNRQWLELGQMTIADLAVFPYVALAHEGKISLEPYPNISIWCDRLKQLPGFVSMPGIQI